MDPYSTLQVNRTANVEEIRRSYQKLVKQYHPDKHSKDLSGAEKAKALEVFHRITKAYHLLTDPKLRQEFDTKSNAERLTQQWPISATVDLDDMTYDIESHAYSTSCRCGGGYTLTEVDLEGGVDIVCCSTCTLGIRVLYQVVSEGGET